MWVIWQLNVIKNGYNWVYLILTNIESTPILSIKSSHPFAGAAKFLKKKVTYRTV